MKRGEKLLYIFIYLFFFIYIYILIKKKNRYLTDLEPPKIAKCPDDIHETSKEKWTKIFFPGVTVTDNVGVHLLTTSRKNGSDFTWGEHNVTYSASDKAGNTAKCHFQVVIVGMYGRLEAF